ncbi:hypothetical protein [Bradyrhizobium sp. CB2312]|uniref:hypothetical protein n=1 Tax=Bradyrhizobium sp. CB2312 TaxID=3039155 RepID=UPI0024B13E83|nr:hypothetical protein [Bradyrhizobium sp. CB2312]WFU75055.1 hypothetical protein QA642_14010 [Bradyrhizobium sp. CB2312]
MFVQRCTELFVRAAENCRLPQVTRNAAKETIGSDEIAEVLFALIGLALLKAWSVPISKAEMDRLRPSAPSLPPSIHLVGPVESQGLQSDLHRKLDL